MYNFQLIEWCSEKQTFARMLDQETPVILFAECQRSEVDKQTSKFPPETHEELHP